MAVTLLKTREPTREIVLPQSRGVESRNVRRYPIPPRTSFALLTAVIEELRAQGHQASYHVQHEQLVDWDQTHRYNQRSWGSEDEWRPDPKAPTVLRFVAGGSDVRVTVDGHETRLEARHLRMGRQGLRVLVAGRT